MIQHKVVSLFKGLEKFHLKILGKREFLPLHQRLTSCNVRTLSQKEKSLIF